MIVFGHNNFRLKSFTQQELGFPLNPGEPKVEFIVKQHYAHLFWIPIFPIGKIYAIKKENDPNLYEMPLEIKALIKANKPVKTSPFSFSLFIILAVVALGYVGLAKLDSIQSQNRQNQYRAEQVMKVNYPTTGDFYRFSVFSEGDNSSYSSDKIILKIDSYTDNSVVFASVKEDERWSRQYGYGVSQEFGNETDYNTAYFEIEKSKLESLVNEGGYNQSKKYFVEKEGLYFQFEEMGRKPLTKNNL